MKSRGIRIIVVGAIAISGVVASLVIRHNTQAQLRQGEERFEQQNAELASLAKEHQRLTNMLTRARCSATNSPVHTTELIRLRAEAEALRKQTNELAKARQARPKLSHELPSIPVPPRASSTKLYGVEMVVSASDSEQYRHELYKMGASSPHSGPFNINARKDAQNLGHAIKRYALDHDGELPSSFDLPAAYFLERYRVPHASEYEIVYQGSLNDFTNIPKQAIALVREREPWPTPAGKLGRIYVMANGFVRFVESDDNFQAWEAEHVIPPR
jgi:hypothetical protein